MARIRQIKPEFFFDEAIGGVPPRARLLFIGMWTMADGRGQLPNKPGRIAAEILPYDHVIGQIGPDLDALEDARLIRRAEGVITIVDWLKWQGPEYGSSWRTAKLFVLERDGRKCQECGSDRRIDVHHKKPIRLFGGDSKLANDPRNLITLCRKCHATADAQFRKGERS